MSVYESFSLKLRIQFVSTTHVFSCDYFKSEKTKPLRNAWKDHIVWRLSYLHQYIGPYPVFDAHAKDPDYAESKIIFNTHNVLFRCSKS